MKGRQKGTPWQRSCVLHAPEAPNATIITSCRLARKRRKFDRGSREKKLMGACCQSKRWDFLPSFKLSLTTFLCFFPHCLGMSVLPSLKLIQWTETSSDRLHICGAVKEFSSSLQLPFVPEVFPHLLCLCSPFLCDLCDSVLYVKTLKSDK